MQSAFARAFPALAPPQPLAPLPAPGAPGDDAAREALALHAAMVREVGHLVQPSRRVVAETAMRAVTMLAAAGQTVGSPQLVIVVDRNPAVQMMVLMLARPGGAEGWRAVGAAHVSTGQARRRDYYLTPLGAFPHTDAILDFRAAGTRNEHHVRGLGTAGMRVWDFGWQWALKGWHTDNAGGDIRLQMHATDPDLLERKLGHPASEGCVRLSSSLNRFLDQHGVLDADYERAAATDGRYAALLLPGRTPSPLAGRPAHRHRQFVAGRHPAHGRQPARGLARPEHGCRERQGFGRFIRAVAAAAKNSFHVADIRNPGSLAC